MFGARSKLIRFSKRFVNFNSKRNLCNPSSPNKNPQNLHPNLNHNNNNNNNGRVNDIRDIEAYRDLDKLDFMKAAKILFSEPPKMKSFGLDFHLVQLFFALMPSLAVYLVAQYARYEIRRMEAEQEVKKKAEEEKKAKEMEATATDEKGESDTELLKVKERLNALEETIKEIVVETKKRPSDDKSKSTEQNQEKIDTNNKSEDQSPAAKSLTTTQVGTLGSRQPLKQQDSGKGESQKDESK